ncbi:MAG: PQQ-dependent sugar dehydrogenase [Gammaproteobacteria bacterium]|nr:PQQ-dependent sugar dehydrogenase [Gammaproteobacteria bacterium]MDH3446859.1 PQQ-dependent sugar dehydrogenase [Gammaproteobacteria bacterium]
MACALLPLLGGAALAAGDEANLSKLGAFKTTGTGGGESIPQEGKYADNIRKVLETIRLPEGFKIELFALAPDARHMAVGRNKGTVWIGTKKSKIWAATDRDMDNVADTVEEFSPSVKFDIPNGVCYSPDGFLFVAERNRVMMFPAAEFFMESPDTVALPIVPQGKLIPVEEESYNHTARVCAIGPDDKLYISLGQPFNVSPPDKQELYNKVGIGGMIRMNRDGSGREVVATGIRNSVGHAFNPKDGSLWFTDNQVDGMGDETPPGEINRMPGFGNWYGHPYYGGGKVRTNEYKDKKIPDSLMSKYVDAQVETIAHAADLGMMFYTGNMFPARYKNAIFSAQHGSWNATKPRGARVMVTFLDDKGNAASSVPFAEGWLQENGVYSGRPVDVQQYVDGSILVSDDKAGAVYRISYAN